MKNNLQKCLIFSYCLYCIFYAKQQICKREQFVYVWKERPMNMPTYHFNTNIRILLLITLKWFCIDLMFWLVHKIHISQVDNTYVVNMQ